MMFICAVCMRLEYDIAGWCCSDIGDGPMKDRIAATLLPLLKAGAHVSPKLHDDDYLEFMHHSIIGTGKSSFSSHEHAYKQARPFTRGSQMCTQ